MSLTVERIATCILFIIVGILMSAWATIAPFAKVRIGASDSLFGVVILCMGVGSVIAMQLTGTLMHKVSERTIATAAMLLFGLAMPLLALANSPLTLGASLFIFGAAIGSLEIVMNHQAAAIEVKAKQPLMSGFHAWFSVGGFLGAIASSQLLEVALSPFSVICTLLLIVVLPYLWAQKHFDSQPSTARTVATSAEDGQHTSLKTWVVWPKGSVTIAAALCFIVFLAEGAVLDWSSVFLVQSGKLNPERAGLGYASFAGAMTLFRFTGDSIIKVLGRPLVMQAGSLLASLGLFLAAWSSGVWLSLLGFAMVGLGAANIVPILFSSISHQRTMSPAAALTAMTTFGYAGILLGPAFIGWVSEYWGMTNALAFVAILLIFVAVLGTRIPLTFADKTPATSH